MTKTFKLAPEPTLVTCPKCKETYTHHGATRLFTRDTEDADTGNLVVSEGFSTLVKAQAPMGNNPSRRRNGIAIDMECEACGPIGRLAIFQHKGQTFIGWQN